MSLSLLSKIYSPAIYYFDKLVIIANSSDSRNRRLVFRDEIESYLRDPGSRGVDSSSLSSWQSHSAVSQSEFSILPSIIIALLLNIVSVIIRAIVLQARDRQRNRC